MPIHGEPLSHAVETRDAAPQWICPGCYHHLPPDSPFETICPNCARRVRLTVVSRPIYKSELILDKQEKAA